MDQDPSVAMGLPNHPRKRRERFLSCDPPTTLFFFFLIPKNFLRCHRQHTHLYTETKGPQDPAADATPFHAGCVESYGNEIGIKLINLYASSDGKRLFF